MKTSAGILSYEIYNQEGKNELFISQQDNYTQLLKLKLRNSSPYHRIEFKSEKTPHLTLKFKKGILPKGFKKEHIKIKKYRLIKGSDLFSGLDEFLFDKDKMEQDENFQVDVQKILDSIDENQATRSVVTEGVSFGIESLLEYFNNLKPEEKTTTYKWIGQLEQIQTDYKAALASIRKLTLSNDVIKANPLFTSIIQETVVVFEKLTELQQNSFNIENSLDALAKQVHEQQKADIQSLEINFQNNYKKSTKHLINALKTNLKAIIVDALRGTKIKDITNFQALTINEDIVKQLEQKVFIQANVQHSDWIAEITTLSDEEDAIDFTCNKEIELTSNEYLLIDFELIGALKGMAKSVATELNYENLVFQKNGVEDTSIKEKISQSILNLVNDGVFGVPPALELLAAEGKNILNNGEYNNTIKLSLINKSRDNISLSDFSKLQLSFYNQQENETVAYALQGKDDALDSVKIVIPNLDIQGFLSKNTALIKEKLGITLNNIKRLQLPFQDFTAIFYTNYSVSTKANGNKTKLYTGVIAIKTTSNSIAIYQPFPNPQNASVRDLETKEISASAFSSLNETGFQLVNEPMEITGTFDLDNSGLAIAQKAPVRVSLVGLANRVTSFDLAKLANSSTIQTTYQNQNAINTVLAPNQSLNLVLNGIKTQLPVGEAILKVSLLNIPNYKDAHLTTTVNRVAYLNSAKAGIFTTGDTNDNITILKEKVEINGLSVSKDYNKTIIQRDNYSLEIGSNGVSLKKGETTLFEVKDIMHRVLPIGSIIMWGREERQIPLGWKVCNGDDRTPDLRSRFIVGAGQSRTDSTLTNYRLGDREYGKEKITLTTDQMPKHRHTASTLSDGSHSHLTSYKYVVKGKKWSGGIRAYSPDGGNSKDRGGINSEGKHNHTVNMVPSGESQSHENRPPYYALYYIMRVS